MKTKVSRWGNSLALRLPKGMAASHRITEGSDIEIIEREDGLLLSPVFKQFSFDELMERMSPDNLHEEISTGEPQGMESW